jgi:hypothetical protein
MRELHGANSTHSQSVQAAIHTWMYPDRGSRPDVVAPIAKWIHVLSSAAMLAITLLTARRRLTANPIDQLLFLGCLCALMMLITPISHLHYYAMVLPLISGLWLRHLSDGGNRRTAAMLTAWGIITAIPAIPEPHFEWLREAGFGTLATIGLWAYALRLMGTSRFKTNHRGTETQRNSEYEN